MYESCLSKQEKLKNLFNSFNNKEAKYHYIIELGKTLPPFDPKNVMEANRVHGCQSVMYLHSTLEDGKVRFAAQSDALISLGLAALLIHIYNNESPETILKCPPTVLDDLKIAQNLTPNRANGLYQIHLKMKQDALRLLLKP